MIDFFTGKYRFLSNFYPCEIKYEGIVYSSIEHAYQAAKTHNKKLREKISCTKTSKQARRLGKNLVLRKDWENVKLKIMYSLLLIKFKDSELRRKLIGTGNVKLIEGNWWGDTFWGICKYEGRNNLGKLLMRIRKEIKSGKENNKGIS